MRKYARDGIRNDLNISIKKEKTFWNKEDELSSYIEEIDSSKCKYPIMDNIENIFPTSMETKEIKDNISENDDNDDIYLLHKKTKKEKKEYFKIIKDKRYRDKKIFGRLCKYLPKSGKHNKFSDDNIIIKIKTYFFNNFLPDIVNKNVKNKSYFIKKLQNLFIRKIEAQTNLNLLDTVYADILKKEKISKKYSKSLPDENKIIVNKILEENDQIKVIRILNLKIGELFEIFRRKLFENEENISFDLNEKLKGLDLLDNNKYKDFDFFINNLNEKEEMSKKKFIEYQYKLKRFCINYEKWFKKRVKKINKNKKVIDIFLI